MKKFPLNINRLMKNQFFISALLATLLTSFTGCEIVGGIFKAGMGVGIFIVVLVIALIIFLISRMGKNK
ncbi:MAG: hypothetical protein ABI723_21800 [Bacteroidia bacterium]